jgi:hypothetical protein
MSNDVYQLSSKRLRVLWSNPEVIFYIDIDSDRALPEYAPRGEFEHLMAKGELEIIEDPHINISMTFPASGSKSEDIQNRAWGAIEDAVNAEPNIYVRKQRGQLLTQAMEKSGATKQTIYRWFRRYWQLGQCKNTLNGQYNRCGGLGKTKKKSGKKLGAPRTRTPGDGVNVDDNIKAIFRVAIEKCLLNESQYEFDYAYNQVLIAFGVPLPCKPEHLLDVPTARQFRYFYNKEYSPLEVTRKRKGEINYQKDYRPVLSSSTTEVSGPGSRYQIDATIADVYLVSADDRNKVIGRPTMYFVVDVFSRAIVGMYMGLENASWVSAMEALSNTVLDKVEYCKQFDIEITKEMWPTVGLPETIIGDRGEILGRHIEVLSKAFNVDIENTPPYRADWKGIVERYFKTVQVKMKPFVEGYVTKEAIGKKRHGKDYRQDSTLTLKEFTQMMIKIVIFYNNEHTLSEYDPDKGLPNDLPYNPLDLWEWGIQYRTGRLRRPSSDIVKVNLLPHTEATVTEKGLKLFNCYYTCKEALDWGWFEGNYNGAKKVTIAYDLYSANVIYLRLNDNYATFITAALAPRSRAYQDLTMWEVWQRNDINADVAATSRLKSRSGSVNLVNDLETIAARSKAAQPINKALTKSEKVTGIRENKRLERQQERIKKYENQDVNQQPDNVTSLHSDRLNPKSYKLPTSLKDILKSDSDDE